MFFNKIEKETIVKPNKQTIDIRSSFEKEYQNTPGFIENNQDIVDNAERIISIEQSTEDKENAEKRDVPIHFEKLSEFTGGAIISPAMSYEKKGEKRKAIEETGPVRIK